MSEKGSGELTGVRAALAWRMGGEGPPRAGSHRYLFLFEDAWWTPSLTGPKVGFQTGHVIGSDGPRPAR